MKGQVRRLLLAVTVLTAWSLVRSPTTYGQTCTPDFLRQAVEQLQADQKRPEAQQALQQCGPAAVNALESALTNTDPLRRRAAAQTLGQMGQTAQSAAQALKTTSQDDQDTDVRSSAVQALTAIGQELQTDSEQWTGWQVRDIQELKTYKEQLDAVLTALEKDPKTWPTKAKELAALRLIRNGIQNQLNGLSDQAAYKVVAWGQNNPGVIGIGIGVMGVVTAYGTVFWLRPLWLLKLGDEPIQAIATIPHVGTALSGVLKALLPFRYHPRVLDAWVNRHYAQAAQAFLALTTVQERQIHIPLPVCLSHDQVLPNGLSAADLTATFKKRPAVLLITGEGGAGKTSLACRIAQWGLDRQLADHRLLPVLIETELDDKRTLTEAIRGQLNALINEPDDIPTVLLEKLLQHQRLLVIVDHFSEMGEATRKQISPELATFPAKALVITSRLEEPLGGVPTTLLKPLRIEADRLLGFMQSYVRWRLKKQDDPFIDDEYSVACDRLRRMVGQRNITVLLARLYAEQMIEQQQGAGGVLPDNVPELMLSYLNQLNRTIEPDQQRDRLQVQKEAQVIAWECLKQTYRPAPARREEVLQVLREIQSTEGLKAQEQASSDCLKYLEKRLRLVQTLEPGDKIRIVLDPLAEYLAASHLVECSRTQANLEVFWQNFFDSIEPLLEQGNDTPAAIQGFLLAVRDCCLVKLKEANIPAGVPEELTRRAGLDPEVLRREEEKRRVRLLISELSAPELEYRIEAAEKLSRLGTAAKMSEPNLIGMLENRNQDLMARQAAAQTLGNLGIGDAALLKLLNDTTDELALRRSAAESLGLMKAGKAELLKLLESHDQPLPIRQGAARALSLIGTASGEAVPMLIVELKEGQAIAQVRSIPVWKEPLTEGLTLDLVLIPGGEFLMGSPPEESGRDWYEYSFPELKGVDVEAQHPVTVPPFSMSQFPITQAQWRFVAQLPPINRDLNPDPASFKGDRHPIETVSWHDATEFCARLSQHTGKTYRLPSEAEWEYACRGGTTTPFHFGATLSTEIANYNGNYTYGDGEKGEYRQKTTEVGSFGLVNSFGLADMHGNVWEWCLDHWHPSYEGAPDDGSAWVTDGDDRYRLLRGGSWYCYPRNCRSAIRSRPSPTNLGNYDGFRVVCLSPCTLQCQNR